MQENLFLVREKVNREQLVLHKNTHTHTLIQTKGMPLFEVYLEISISSYSQAIARTTEMFTHRGDKPNLT